MERSSPLAAMQPQPVPMGHWNCDIYSSQLRLAGLEPGDFNFKDLSMANTQRDYFGVRPSRGASPTSNLAADMCQNLSIDRSPHLQTPRRSLFTTNLLNCGAPAPTSPPHTSSSPCPDSDSMDISPLPHKLPYSTTIVLQGPTPEPTPRDQDMLSSPAIIPESPLVALKPTINERRRPTLSRPTLSRTKGLTTSAVPIRSAGCEIPPPFKFGNLTMLARSTAVALEECFIDSPEQASFPSPLRSPMGPPRPKSSHQKPNPLQSSVLGSPMAAQARRSAPAQRPRKQFRRSLSMFEHPLDVHIQQQQDVSTETSVSSAMDLDEQPQFRLPHFVPEQDTIPRITKETMIDVLDGKYAHLYNDSMIIDCRFEYEYDGGHVDGAINFNDKQELAKTLFKQCSEVPRSKHTLLIFHCEYSAHRAPIAARYIRGEDRAANAHQYPQLTYPEIYILDGGYSSFFKQHKGRCFPQNYVEMNDKAYETACERGLGRIKQQRVKLGRAQTFAFGQHDNGFGESPIPTLARCVGFKTTMDIPEDIPMEMSLQETPTAKRGNSRRMASF